MIRNGLLTQIQLMLMRARCNRFPIYDSEQSVLHITKTFDKAGIDPSTLTGPDDRAFEDSKKDELGLTAVVDVSRTSFHCQQVTIYLETIWIQVLTEMMNTYIDMLNDGGKVDEDRLTDFANFVGLLNQYSDPALFVSGTFWISRS